MTKEEFIEKFIVRLNFVGNATKQEMTKIASEANEKVRSPNWGHMNKVLPMYLSLLN